MVKNRRAGFTLVELLVVIAIVTVLAAILAPVFSTSRGRSRQAVCISNQKQLGLAIMMYAQDYDETFPNGLNYSTTQRMWAGEGWAGQVYGYIRNPGLLHCPSDSTSSQGRQTAVSYGYNYNLVNVEDYEDDDIPSGIALAKLSSPTRSVMLFEVAGVTTSLIDPNEGANLPHGGAYISASGNGLDNRLYAHKDWSTGIDNTYATGYLGGRFPFDPNSTQFPISGGRHYEGSSYLLCDGHAKWFRGSAVSSGLNALQENCLQDNSNNLPRCGGQFYAAGTDAADKFQVTFTTH